MPEIDLRRKPVLTLHSTFSFGKYKGEPVSRIVEHDPRYIQWVHENVDWLDVDEDVLDMVDDYKGDRTWDVDEERR